MAELPKLTKDDLMAFTWDYSAEPNILGTYEGTLIKGFLFEVIDCGEVNPDAVMRCNVEEGWVEYIKSTTPFGNTRQIFEHAVRDEAGNITFVRAECRVTMKLMTDQGNFITVLKGKDNVGDVAESLGT